MFDRINILKQKGYRPDTIIDIGAHKGDWTNTMLNIYNDCKYYLFEANNYNELNQFNNNINISINNVLLYDKMEQVNWYDINCLGDSIFKELSHHFVNCEPVKRMAIDLNTYILSKNILQESKNIFLKIDCQGAEISILKGSTNILNNTDFILLEVPFFGIYNEGVGNFLEHIKFMDSIGFIPYDLIENHYIN